MENPPNLSFRLQGLNLSFPYRRWRINYCCLVNSKNEGLGWMSIQYALLGDILLMFSGGFLSLCFFGP